MTPPRRVIADIAEVNPRLPTGLTSDLSRTVDFVPMADLSEDGVVHSNETRPLRDVIKGYTYFENGDVVVAKITPCMENGKAAYVDTLRCGIGFGSTEFHVLRPGRDVDGQYLFWMIWGRHFRQSAQASMTGSAGQKRVPAGFFGRYEIPVPALAEQKRIAAILDAANALRVKRRASIEQLDSLVQATFLEMFGDASNDWEHTTVGQLAAATPSSIRTGPFGSQLLHSEFTDEGIRVLGIDNAVANEFREGAPRFISPVKYEQLRRYTVIPGDVVITIMGTCGRCAIVPDGIGTAINTKHLCCITLEKTRCLPRFLHAYFLRHPVAQHHLRSQTKGAIMEGLNMGIIKMMPVRLPPLDLQARFTSIVESIEQHKARLKAHLAEFDTLFASLQSRALSGELCSSSPSRRHASA